MEKPEDLTKVTRRGLLKGLLGVATGKILPTGIESIVPRAVENAAAINPFKIYAAAMNAGDSKSIAVMHSTSFMDVLRDLFLNKDLASPNDRSPGTWTAESAWQYTENLPDDLKIKDFSRENFLAFLDEQYKELSESDKSFFNTNYFYRDQDFSFIDKYKELGIETGADLKKYVKIEGKRLHSLYRKEKDLEYKDRSEDLDNYEIEHVGSESSNQFIVHGFNYFTDREFTAESLYNALSKKYLNFTERLTIPIEIEEIPGVHPDQDGVIEGEDKESGTKFLLTINDVNLWEKINNLAK
jgi:hypothetical protein